MERGLEVLLGEGWCGPVAECPSSPPAGQGQCDQGHHSGSHRLERATSWLRVRPGLPREAGSSTSRHRTPALGETSLHLETGLETFTLRNLHLHSPCRLKPPAQDRPPAHLGPPGPWTHPAPGLLSEGQDGTSRGAKVRSGSVRTVTPLSRPFPLPPLPPPPVCTLQGAVETEKT